MIKNVTALMHLGKIENLSAASSKITPKAEVKNFTNILNLQKELESKGMPNTGDIFKDIQAIQQSILNGKNLSTKDLILYQIKTGQYGLRVELISKVAESAISSVKKFQNQQ